MGVSVNSPAVVVVGAGPTGLTLACGLLLHGVSVRVVDEAPGPTTTSRANILYGRGVEVLGRLDALGDLVKRSVEPVRLTTYVNGRPLLTMHLADLFDMTGTRYQPLYVSQAEVEAQLRSRLADLGGAVECAAGLVDTEQDDGGVITRRRQQLRAGWLIGCDGAHSTVRKLAGTGFPGVSVIEQFLLADVHADWALDRSAGSIYLHRDGVLAAIPMLGEFVGLHVSPQRLRHAQAHGRVLEVLLGGGANERGSVLTRATLPSMFAAQSQPHLRIPARDWRSGGATPTGIP
jgi:2-polyprenyl-6-methoxyphenol hydroxylase-like FAD-dependent oxidoreductase